ncbi:YhfC family intramembrane metalloprotease [Brevibacillus sp. SYSU BS000544]|uniref:YhfC family intramembrane metalloprotease n=1 Tax=Brevibacillus sp. SYSU BS000544 TaxID=3416443 RepID=UPI003CE4D569
MVSQWSMIGMIVQGMIAFLFPLCLFIYFRRTYKITYYPVFVGALVFFVFSQVLEKLLHLVVINPAQPLIHNPFLVATYGALAAGLFEEVGRYVGFKLLLKKQRDYKDGLSVGIGHGGIEAILLVAIPSIMNLVYANLLNQGTFEQSLGSKLPADILLQLKTALVETAPYLYIVGGIERVCAVLMHMALTLLVLVGIRQAKGVYLLYAIGLHALFDFIPALYQVKVVNIWVAEAAILLTGLLSLWFIAKSRTLFSL